MGPVNKAAKFDAKAFKLQLQLMPEAASLLMRTLSQTVC